jgi:hypothetical protein
MWAGHALGWVLPVKANAMKEKLYTKGCRDCCWISAIDVGRTVVLSRTDCGIRLLLVNDISDTAN